MTIVVCDANILIDLLQVDLFKAFLKLKWEMHVPPDVVDEVQEENSDLLIQAIQSRDILLPVFTPEELFQIQDYKARYQPLSIQDCSCLLLAENLSAVLLTGEKKLKTIATTSHGIQVHGVLWIFEHLVGKQLITPHMAHADLSLLLTLNNRLPKAECERLLKRWRKVIARALQAEASHRR
jgi:predicted nucleic acid-binding protein